jgi:hypothetical protein
MDAVFHYSWRALQPNGAPPLPDASLQSENNITINIQNERSVKNK